MKQWLVIIYLGMIMPLCAQMNVLVFAGSTREDSYNKKLAHEAALIATEMGAQVTEIDLKNYPMPLFDEDLESNQGMPENARAFRNLLIQNQAVVIASPEYNGSISATLKNVIDWATRNEKGEPSRDAFKDKKFAIMGASPSKMGGSRGLTHLNFILEGVGAKVVSTQVTVPDAYDAFNENGALKDKNLQAQLKKEINELLK